MKTRFCSRAGVSLVEMLIGMAVMVAVGSFSLFYLRAGTILFAKNVSTNLSHNTLRGALDATLDRVQSAYYRPVLIDTTGAATVSPAAGIYYDRLLGEPYVLASGTGLPATTTSLVVTRSSNAYASPPIPQTGDVILIDGAPANTRPMVASVTTQSISGNQQNITVTLTAALGTALSWSGSKTAQLIHREALIVMPNGSGYELRRYPDFETTTNLADPTKYIVVTNQIGNQGSEPTPFSLVTSGADQLLALDLVIRATSASTNFLANKEANQFSNYQRVQTKIPLRLRPVN